MSDYSQFLIDYYNGLRDRLCFQDLISTCSGTKEETPTISGSFVDGVKIVTITNYNASNYYFCAATSGTYSINNNVISWDNVNDGTLAVYAIDNTSILSDPSLYTIYNSKLLLHLNGLDNGTLFPDSSPYNHPVSSEGNVVTKTAVKKFGTASAYFDGTGDSLRSTSTEGWDFEKNNFTIDFWIYPTVTATARAGLISSSNGFFGWTSYTTSSSRVVRFSLPLTHTVDGSENDLLSSGARQLTLNTWNHVAIIRKGTGPSDLNIYIGGVAGTTPVSGDITINGLYPIRLDVLDVDDPGDTANGVWADDNFVYLANGTGGLHVYSVDSNGQLTHLSSNDRGGTANSVCGDGNFIYLANGSGGLVVYSVDGGGNLTYKSTYSSGGLANGVWCDGTFIYLSSDDTYNLQVFTVDGNGILTRTGYSTQTSGEGLNVRGDGTFIYVANGTVGLYVFSVSELGQVTYKSYDDYLQCTDIAINGDYIYSANYTYGLVTYSVDGNGALTKENIFDVLSNNPQYLHISNNYLYFTGNNRIGVYSISESSPVVKLLYQRENNTVYKRRIFVKDNFIFITGTTDGLYVYKLNTSYTPELIIGRLPSWDSTTYGTTGYIDEVRILNGVAAWTSDFTPPSAPY